MRRTILRCPLWSQDGCRRNTFDEVRKPAPDRAIGDHDGARAEEALHEVLQLDVRTVLAHHLQKSPRSYFQSRTCSG